MIYIKHFSQLSKSDNYIAGGKGASLGEMTQAGILVPPGFVVLSAGFEKFLESTDLNIEIDSILHSVNIKEMHTIENASEKIKDLILKAKMPKDIREEIKKEFKNLKSEFVAVRSSATAEDSSSAAWAGQLDTFLNTTEKTLLANVQKCWASLFTPRAIFYRFEKWLHNSKISVAVVVQKMVQSEISGIAFSVHPVTQDHNQMIIEAGYGLGEAIVSGQITPDSYVVEKNPRRIIDKNVSIQERGIYRKSKDGGNEWQDISQEKGERQKLTDEQILELSEIVIKIENHYGSPQDIEWAYEKNKFYITQSRPITTLSEQPLSDKTNLNLSEKFLLELGNQELRPPVYDSSIFVHSSGWQTKKYIDKYYQDKTPYPLIIFVKQSEGLIFLPATKEKALAEEILTRYWKGDATINKIETQFSNLSKKIEKLNKQLTYQFIRSKPYNKLLKFFKSLNDHFLNFNALVFFSIYLDREICERVVNKLRINISTERLNEIWPKASVPIGISFEKKREFYLFSLILKEETWESIAEKCQYFSATYNKISSVANVKKDLFAKYGKLTKTDVKKLINEEIQLHKKRQKDFDQWLKTLRKEEKRIIEFIQFAIEVRDARKDYIMKPFALFYRFAESLFDRHDINKNLIMFYGVDELLKGEDYFLANIVKIKERTNGCTVFVHYDGEHEYEYGTFESNKELVNKHYLGQHIVSNDKEIIGQTGSSGIVRGLVRIIINFEDQKKDLKEGEILVTGMTRPEFVPLMKISSGIITDEGGITCHAAIVSREIGIPCVVGTKIATQVLHNGDLVEVDADKGVVRILERANAISPKVGRTTLKDSKTEITRERLSYKFFYESQGYYFLLDDIIASSYTSWPMVELRLGDWKRVYVPEKVIKENHAKGLSFTKEEINLKLDEIQKLTKKLRGTLFEKASRKIIFQAVEIIDKLFKHYSYFDTSYSEGIYAKNPKDERVLLIERSKNVVRDDFDFIFFRENSVLKKLIKRVTELAKINADEIRWYRIIEIENLLNKKINLDVKEIEARKKACVFDRNDKGQMIFLSGKKAKSFIKNFEDNLEKESGAILRGTVANGKSGKIVGRVCIINRDYSNHKKLIEDMEAMEEKSILVTTTTDPEFMPAIKKSSAIITDIDGLLSHAAISARELDIPCVVGTKIATKVLHDGDLVEVDADKGVVRILEKAK